MNPERESPLESEIGEFAEILRPADGTEPPVIVGGHAAGFWSRYFLSRGVTELAAYQHDARMRPGFHSGVAGESAGGIDRRTTGRESAGRNPGGDDFEECRKCRQSLELRLTQGLAHGRIEGVRQRKGRTVAGAPVCLRVNTEQKIREAADFRGMCHATSCRSIPERRRSGPGGQRGGLFGSHMCGWRLIAGRKTFTFPPDRRSAISHSSDPSDDRRPSSPRRNS
jgi:hypothetical protein